MNKKTLGILVAVVLVLAVVYGVSSKDKTEAPRGGLKNLMEGISGENVAKIKIEQGDKTLDVELKDGEWRVPARGDYRADGGKVRSFLLKMFDLEVSQKLPANGESLDKLGLSDEAIKRGQTKVTFLNNTAGEIGSLRIGEARKGKTPASPQLGGAGTAQYVKRSDQDDVYLATLPVALSALPSAWLDTNVLSILSANLKKVEVYSTADGASTLEFVLFRRVGQDGNFGAFELEGGVPPDAELQQNIVSQVTAGLENLKFDDVFKADDPEVRDIKFDTITIYRTESGLIYRVESAEKDGKTFARVSVQFDADAAKEIETYNSKIAAAPTPAATPDAAVTPAATGTPAVKQEKKPVATEEDAKNANNPLAEWVYQFPDYQGKKFREKRASFFKARGEQSAPPANGNPADALHVGDEHVDEHGE